MQVQVTRIHEAGGGGAADASGFSAAAESHKAASFRERHIYPAYSAVVHIAHL